MNAQNLTYRGIHILLILMATLGLYQCEPTKQESNNLEDTGTKIEEDKTILRYQLFNLELALEESLHNQKGDKTNDSTPTNKPAYHIALNTLQTACNFNCEPQDYECQRKYIDCTESMATINRYSSTDEDDDLEGPEPLPPASDTSRIAAKLDLTELIIFTDEPEVSRFKLMTEEGGLYAISTNSPDLFQYNKEKRLASYSLVLKNPELSRKSLYIHASTTIVNAANEKRVIEIKSPLGLDFSR